MHFIPFLRIRGNEEAEIVGLDEYDMGEFAYDYVGVDQELGHEIEFRPGMGDAGKTVGGVTTGGREPHHHLHGEEHSAESTIEKVT